MKKNKFSKRLMSFVLVFSMMATLLMPATSYAMGTIDDIKGHWAENEIKEMMEGEIIDGYPDGSFKPLENITRAEASSMIYMAVNLKNLGEDPITEDALIFDEAGLYVGEKSGEQISQNVIVKADGVELKNYIIEGDLIIGEEVGDGDVTLTNIEVKGDTYVKGGGIDSIYINGGRHNNIIVQRTPTRAVRIVVTGGNRFNVEVDSQAEDQILILKGNYNKVLVTAPRVKITMSEKSQINELMINEDARETRVQTSDDSRIEKVIIESLGTVFEGGRHTVNRVEGSKKENFVDRNTVIIRPTPAIQGGGSSSSPVEEEVPKFSVEAVTASPSTGEVSLGTEITLNTLTEGASIYYTLDGSNPTSNSEKYTGPISVDSISVTGAEDATTITTDGGTLQMIADVFPNNASNKEVTWSVTPGTGLATIDSNGLLTAVANGTVTVVATAQDGSGVIGDLEITISGQSSVVVKSSSDLWNALDNSNISTIIFGNDIEYQGLGGSTSTNAFVENQTIDGKGFKLTIGQLNIRADNVKIKDLTVIGDVVIDVGVNNFTAQGTNFDYLTISQGFAGGTGTEEDPFIIATAEQLNNVRNYVGPEHSNKYFRQTEDINLNISPWNDGEGWDPIGVANISPFYGKYDGSNFTINGLYINRSDTNSVGLFAELYSGAVVENLKLTNVDITGHTFVGAVSGGWGGYVHFINASIINVHVSGTITGTQYVGGLIGINSNIKLSSSTANVHGNDAGGLAGMLTRYGNLIEQSYSSGEITGTYTGGLVGHNNYGLIKDSYSIADVKGTGSFNGGVVGNSYSFTSRLTNVYAAGKVSSGGGLIGVNHNGQPDYEDSSYWDKDSTGRNISANSESSFGKTTMKMLKQSTFLGWDFDTIWAIDEGMTYPYLRNNIQNPKPAPNIINVTGINIPEGNQFVAEYGTFQLSAAISPVDATNKEVSWSSDNIGVATVNSEGLVTGISEGVASITVTTDDGNFTDTVTITVKEYTFDFESNDGGFTVSGTPGDIWQWGIPVSWPSSAAVGFKCWGTNLNGNYPNNMNETLKSPEIDMRSYSAGDIIQIRWWQAVHIESSVFDQAFAEIVKSNDSNEKIWEHTGGTSQGSWMEMEYQIIIPEEGIDWIKLQFRIITDSVVNYSGYYIDGIMVYKNGE